MGPSFLGFMPFARVYVVPFHSISILETLANLALLGGLELDIRPLVRASMLYSVRDCFMWVDNRCLWCTLHRRVFRV